MWVRQALEIFRSVELLCAEPLAVGTYEEMLEHPVEFESTIPARLGLPPLPTPNRAEGVGTLACVVLCVSCCVSCVVSLVRVMHRLC